MKKIILTSLFAAIATMPSLVNAQSIYISKNANVSFYSKAALEDIAAKTANATSILNLATNTIEFSVPIKSLTFEKSLMQEHFNENYMESDKYPVATFKKGKINQTISLSKDTTYKVTVTGKLNIHGVEKDRTIDGVIKVEKGIPTVTSTFKVACADHNVEIPKIVTEKIAEVLDIKVSAVYSPYQSKK